MTSLGRIEQRAVDIIRMILRLQEPFGRWELLADDGLILRRSSFRDEFEARFATKDRSWYAIVGLDGFKLQRLAGDSQPLVEYIYDRMAECLLGTKEKSPELPKEPEALPAEWGEVCL